MDRDDAIDFLKSELREHLDDPFWVAKFGGTEPMEVACVQVTDDQNYHWHGMMWAIAKLVAKLWARGIPPRNVCESDQYGGRYAT